MERTLCQRRSSCLRFQMLASKRTPFFQTIKVIAAIFRAKVRRAIAGFIPLASKACVEIVERSRRGCWPWWPHP